MSWTILWICSVLLCGTTFSEGNKSLWCYSADFKNMKCSICIKQLSPCFTYYSMGYQIGSTWHDSGACDQHSRCPCQTDEYICPAQCYIFNIKQNQIYNISVASSSGCKQVYNWYEVKADVNIVKPRQVEDLRVTTVTSRKIMVNWTQPKGFNDTHPFVLDYQLTVDTLEEGRSRFLNCNQSEQGSLIDNLRPVTNYLISVRCKPKQGGHWSDWSSQEIKTKQAAPAKGPEIPPGGYRLTDEALVLFWRVIPKRHRNGVITSYNVILRDAAGKHVVGRNISGNDASGIQLKVDTKQAYTAEVRAFTTAGSSPVSTLRVPGERARLRYPQYVAGEASSDNMQVTFSWRSPAYVNSSSQNYSLHWCLGKVTEHECQDELKSVSLSPYDGRYRLALGKDYRKYLFAMGANNESSSSGMTPWLCVFRHSGRPPEYPSFTFEERSHDNLSIILTPLTCNWRSGSVKVLRYHIYYRSVGSSAKKKTVGPHCSTIALLVLSPDKKYEVATQAESRDGLGPKSNFKLEPDPPTAVANMLRLGLYSIYLPVSVLSVIVGTICIAIYFRKKLTRASIFLYQLPEIQIPGNVSQMVFRDVTCRPKLDYPTPSDLISTLEPVGLFYVASPPAKNADQNLNMDEEDLQESDASVRVPRPSDTDRAAAIDEIRSLIEDYTKRLTDNNEIIYSLKESNILQPTAQENDSNGDPQAADVRILPATADLNYVPEKNPCDHGVSRIDQYAQELPTWDDNDMESDDVFSHSFHTRGCIMFGEVGLDNHKERNNIFTDDGPRDWPVTMSRPWLCSPNTLHGQGVPPFEGCASMPLSEDDTSMFDWTDVKLPFMRISKDMSILESGDVAHTLSSKSATAYKSMFELISERPSCVTFPTGSTKTEEPFSQKFHEGMHKTENVSEQNDFQIGALFNPRAVSNELGYSSMQSLRENGILQADIHDSTSYDRFDDSICGATVLMTESEETAPMSDYFGHSDDAIEKFRDTRQGVAGCGYSSISALCDLGVLHMRSRDDS